jgi:hypothetical protein
MTREAPGTKAPGTSAPGTALLKIAPLLFNDRFIEAAVRPTIADLQAEFAAASSPAPRLRARWRGYRAFWALAFAAPFARWSSGGTALIPAAAAANVITGLGVVALVVTCGAWVGPSYGLVALAGAFFAIVIHTWYDRHPSQLPTPADKIWRTPQINFSSMEVAGNVGGLIFVAGSLLVVSLAVPTVLVFLAAAAVAGGLVAWRLIAWYTTHPNWGLPENRIVLRERS